MGIEYAHIYSDQQFSRQHALGITELHKLPVGPDIKKIVLVDDYSPAHSSQFLDMSDFLQKLVQRNAEPDVVVFESELVPYCEAVLDMISNRKLKKGLSGYYRSRLKYPCSLLVAAWYLLRLGVFGRPPIRCVAGSPEDLFTDRIITILPDSYMVPEARALEIIESTPSSPLIKKIDHIFFPHQEESYSDFDEFDVYEYVERNYGCKLHSEDRQIIEFATSVLSDMRIAPGTLQHVADIGVGPNLYPAMLLSPLISNSGCLELIDIVAKNLSYLDQVLNGPNAEQLRTWKIYDEYIQELGFASDLKKLSSISSIRFGSIFELAPSRYDAVLSFFVADSITDMLSEFIRATDSLMNSLRPNGLFVVAHMVGSSGYFAGYRTFFPAVNLTLAKIEEIYKQYGIFRSRMVIPDSGEAVRMGYEGMVVIVGRKFALPNRHESSPPGCGRSTEQIRPQSRHRKR
ncbi:hypothetical protein [Nocardia sp. NPDC047038]|uniref:hypothetical protein n=1 Tax=Nocardia sp. NPDC047038 TaxID=3154338 RepID=UPI00340750CF